MCANSLKSQAHSHVSSAAVSTLNFRSSDPLIFLKRLVGNMAHPACIHASSRKTDQSSLDMSLTAPQEKIGKACGNATVTTVTSLIQFLSVA